MTRVVIAAGLLATRGSAVSRLLLFSAFTAPITTGVAVLALVARGSFQRARDQEPDPVVPLILELTGRLRSGSSLRAALADGLLGDNIAAHARSGRSLDQLGARTFARFGRHGQVVAATVALATETGGPVAAGFETLAAGILQAEQTRRERRAALAPAVAQAVIVGGVPVLALVQMLVSGRLVDIVSSGAVGAGLVLFGVLMSGAGVATIALLARRAHR